MEKAIYSTQPSAIQYMPLPDGVYADVWLRQNIEEAEEEAESGTYTAWQADEVYFRTDLSEDEVAADFDTLFENEGPVTYEEPTIEERLEVAEEAIVELAALLAGEE